jgi:hypothetical protein
MDLLVRQAETKHSLQYARFHEMVPKMMYVQQHTTTRSIKFYWLNPSLFIPKDGGCPIAAAVRSSVDDHREEFFSFLKSGCLHVSSSEDVMIAVDDTVVIFRSIVCSTQIDWSQCAEWLPSAASAPSLACST